jgi:hypothetical protein
MTDQDNASLRLAVADAMKVFRGNAPRLRAALSPVIDSLESLCASLQRSVAHADPADTRAAVMVVSRDLIGSALQELAAEKQADNRAVLLALATLHNRIVAALEACTVG